MDEHDPASIIIPPGARPGSAGVPPARGPEARAPRKLAGLTIKAHDPSYKLLCSHAKMVTDRLRGFARGDWVGGLDLGTFGMH